MSRVPQTVRMASQGPAHSPSGLPVPHPQAGVQAGGVGRGRCFHPGSEDPLEANFSFFRKPPSVHQSSSTDWPRPVSYFSPSSRLLLPAPSSPTLKRVSLAVLPSPFLSTLARPPPTRSHIRCFHTARLGNLQVLRWAGRVRSSQGLRNLEKFGLRGSLLLMLFCGKLKQVFQNS